MDKIALIDLDGTVADYDQAMRAKLMEMAGPNDPELPEMLHGCPDWLENRCSLIKRQPGFWRNLDPIKEGLRVTNLLKNMDYNLMVLTKGPTTTTEAWTEKRDWCHEHLPGVPVTVTEDKGLVYGKVLFDDFPPYIERWLEWRPRGKVIMPSHPWNKDFNHEQVFKLEGLNKFTRMMEFLENE